MEQKLLSVLAVDEALRFHVASGVEKFKLKHVLILFAPRITARSFVFLQQAPSFAIISFHL